MMKLIALFLSLAVLTGCQSNRITVEPSDRYADLRPAEAVQATAVPLPESPKFRIVEANGEQVAALNKEGVDKLTALRDASRQNAEALELLLTAHNGLVQQRNLMLENLRLEEQRGNFYAEQYAISENARREQYDEFQMELLIHKAMMVIMGIALVL